MFLHRLRFWLDNTMALGALLLIAAGALIGIAIISEYFK